MTIMLLFDSEGPMERRVILNQFEHGGAISCDRFGVVVCDQW